MVEGALGLPASIVLSALLLPGQGAAAPASGGQGAGWKKSVKSAVSSEIGDTGWEILDPEGFEFVEERPGRLEWTKWIKSPGRQGAWAISIVVRYGPDLHDCLEGTMNYNGRSVTRPMRSYAKVRKKKFHGRRAYVYGCKVCSPKGRKCFAQNQDGFRVKIGPDESIVVNMKYTWPQDRKRGIKPFRRMIKTLSPVEPEEAPPSRDDP